MIFNKWLYSTSIFFDKENEGGSDNTVQNQRDGIKVTTMNNNEENTENEEDNKNENNEDNNENENKDVNEEDNEEDEEDAEENDKKEDADVDEKDKEIQKLKKQIERLQKRTARTAGERDQIKKELKLAKEALETKVDESEKLSKEDAEALAERLAEAKLTEREFENAKKKLAKAGKEADKDFMTKINELAEDVAPIPSVMIGPLNDLDHDNGGAVLAYLANNPDEYEEIHILALPRMIARLVKISEKLFEDSKPKPKKISKVPPPNEPVNGNRSSSSILTGKESMEEFVRIRNKQAEEHRKKKLRLA
jgi:hypothetical protein